MPWFRIDDNLPFHHKVVAAGNAAMGLWVRAGALCAQQLTDGFVPEHMVTALEGRRHVGRLVEVGLWSVVEGGYQFHEWTDRQPTRDDVLAEREAARQRMSDRRALRRSSGERSAELPANTERSSGGVRAPRPDPTRPVVPNGTTDGADKPPAKARRRRLPDDFEPTDEHRALAAELGVDLAREFDRFRDHWIGNGEAKADWNATLRNWLRNEKRFGRGRPAQATITRLPRFDELEEPPSGLSPAEYAAWDQAQREKRQGR